MRWDRLFTDLEDTVDLEDRVAREAEIADRVRRELARVELSDRLRANDGPIELLLRGGKVVQGQLVDAGRDWALVQGTAQVLIPTAAIIEVGGLGRSVAAPSDLGRRLTMAHALRVMSRHRVTVSVEDELRRVRTGTIDLVGADFFDLALHPVELPRRDRHVSTIRVIPFGAVVTVTTAADQRALSSARVDASTLS